MPKLCKEKGCGETRSLKAASCFWEVQKIKDPGVVPYVDTRILIVLSNMNLSRQGAKYGQNPPKSIQVP